MNWDEEPSVEWAFALDGLSPDQIKTGLKAMILEGGDFPPSAPTFRSLCGAADWEHRNQSRSWQEIQDTPMIDKGMPSNLITAIPESDYDLTPEQHMANMKKGLF
ncbi:MAG: hypothetical protein DRI24_18180 [Deltaproteobacteria bacterium]|nr:MAG: hypothetical protein DRI24_18180 [Deltaproteobacteria bacterium]